MVSVAKHSWYRQSGIRCRFLLLLAALLANPLEAAVDVEIDRNRIVEGETVTLIFRTDDARQKLDADFSALEQDFEILDRRSETQLSIVNGRQAAVVRLLLTIEPRRTGELQIPAIDFGDLSTRPIRLSVEPAPQLEPGDLPPVFIEAELTPGEGPYYVHAQFGLIVRVFYQLNLTEAAISQPEPSPASVRLLQETPYQAERGGERYRVLERNYAIFPERSGELTIPSMQLTGRLVERRSNGAWQPTVRGRRVRVESEALSLNVESRPAAFTGSTWQPARDFVLSQSVSSGKALRVGEPVTRTVMVDAVGLEENMIVEPAWPEVPDSRIYPDQPQGITRDDGHWVLGHKEFRYAVVPEKEGELVLPELEVDWWDTVNNRQRTAVLPSHTLFVQPSALVPPVSPDPVIQAPAGEPALETARPSAVSAQPGYWQWLTLLFAALWLVTLLAAWRLRGRTGDSRKERSESPVVGENEANMLRQLRQACERQDRIFARRVLRGWLRDYGPRVDGSLLEFAAGLEEGPLQASVFAMASDGFRPDSEMSWDGKDFWKQFKAWNRIRQSEKRQLKPALTDLYAQENRKPG